MKKNLVLLSPLFFALICASAQAQIYKCREANGALLYTDIRCGIVNAKTVAVMPKEERKFGAPGQLNAADAESDATVQKKITVLSGEEANLARKLIDVQAAPGESLSNVPEVHAQRLAILAKLKDVRARKNALLGRGLSRQEQEELVGSSEGEMKSGSPR